MNSLKFIEEYTTEQSSKKGIL